MASPEIDIVSASHFGSMHNNKDRRSNKDRFQQKHNSRCVQSEEGERLFPMYKKHSRISDQWAAEQAKDMINKTSDLNSLSKQHSISSSRASNCSARDPSPTPSDNSSTDLSSVSSLLQKWRGFEAESRNQCTIVNQIQDNENQLERTLSSMDEREEERTRVADIVRKWANCSNRGNDRDSNECRSSIWPHLMRLNIGVYIRDQQVIISPIVCTPRIRERHAVMEICKRLQKDRYKEVECLRARLLVSKFPQRRRIQTLLRLKFLRREVCAVNEKQLPSSKGEGIQCEPISTIDGFRKKPSTIKAQERDFVKDSTKSMTNTDQNKEMTSTSEETSAINALDDGSNNQMTDKQSKIESSTSENNGQILPSETQNYKQDMDKMFVEGLINDGHYHNLNDDRKTVELHEEDIRLTCHYFRTLFPSMDMSEVNNEYKLEDSYENVLQRVVSSRHMNYSTSDEEQLQEEEEEEEDIVVVEEQDGYNGNLDWIIDIARPRSYWEDLRKAWYQEIFNTRSQDAEIRQLLERGSVSSVLASDFRDKMDHLVMSNLQRAFRPTTLEENQDSISFENVHVPEHKDDEDQHECSIPKQDEQLHLDNFHDDVDDGQTMSSSQFSETCYGHNNETSDESDDQMASNDEGKQCLYQSYYHDPRQEAPLKNFSSIEMELIFDLRAHMQQLSSEISKLRRSVATCVDMQVKLQKSIRDGLPLSSHIKGKRKKSSTRNTKKGKCCICCEKMADSLLYRCGHICTCFSCANKIMSSTNKKCPLCQACIIDVVRICADA